MINLTGQSASPSHEDELFSNHIESPEQIRQALIARILSFVADLERLLLNPLLADTLDFLDTIATHLVSLETLGAATQLHSPQIQETGLLISNMLRCIVSIKNQGFSLSCLDAAKIYRRKRTSHTPLNVILKSCYQHLDETRSLLNELKLLSFDLIVETENT